MRPSGAPSPTIVPQPTPWPSARTVVLRPILVLLVGLGLFIILPAILIPRLGLQLDLRDRTLVAFAGTLIAELILFAFLLRWLHAEGRTLRDIGFGRPTTAGAVAFGVLFAVVYAVYTLHNPAIGTHAREVSLFKLAGVTVGLVAAVIEECAFRGYIMSSLERCRVSTPKQVLLSGMAFGIIHAGFDWIGVVLTFLLGVVLAGTYVLGKRSLTPSIVSHALVNLAIEPWLLLFIVDMYGKLARAVG